MLDGGAEPDADEVAAFWTRFLAATGRNPDEPVPDAWPFGDTAELAEELIGLVLEGRKRATAGAAIEYEREGSPLPQVGDVEILLDGSLRPRAAIRATDVRVGPLSSVDDQFAWDEGEGDRTRSFWLDAHTTFFQRYLPQIGAEFTEDMETVFQRFEVLYSEAD